MFNLRFLMKKHKITIKSLAKVIDLNEDNLGERLLKKKNFKIEELEAIKKYFVDEKIIDENYDIGDFLNEV